MLHLFSVFMDRFGKILVKCLQLLLVIILLYGAFCIYDILTVNRAASNDRLVMYRPGSSEAEEGGLSELVRINVETVGWITVDGTGIDYPITRTNDNTKYVNTDIFNRFSLSGCPFLDCRNRRDFRSGCSIVYGHHMKGGLMFGDLDRFLNSRFFDTHRDGRLYTADGKDYKIEWFASVRANAYDEFVYSELPSLNEFSTIGRSEKERMILEIRERAVCFADIDAGEGDAWIALSTCTESDSNERILLFGIIREIYS